MLAFDLGATSGRGIIGTLNNNRLETYEISRFPNRVINIHGKLYWNLLSLFESMKETLAECVRRKIPVDSIGIDTWGVDFVYLGKDGSLLSMPRAYRDPYTERIPEQYFTHIPREEVYRITGTQIMNFNSVYQLYAARKENYAPHLHADKILFIPDALAYLLTGKCVCEYTIASTAQLLNARSREIEPALLQPAGMGKDVFPGIVFPGEKIGLLSELISRETGFPRVPVISVAGHDTASAIAAVPAQDEKFAYLSSGTWSLMGIELEEPIITKDSYRMNFTNEGGIEGTIRFLKNITGMWILEECLKIWKRNDKPYDYEEIILMAQKEKPFQRFIDPDSPAFACPKDMLKAIAEYCSETGQLPPENEAETVRCIFDSLAMKYNYVLGRLKKFAPFPIEKLHIIGGGAKNPLLNQFTANTTGIPVISGPAEATAIGNLLLQAKALGLVENRHDMRRIIRNGIRMETFMPVETDKWQKAYREFLNITRLEE